jgi:hypothetical protein
MSFAKRHNLFVIEDNSEWFLSIYMGKLVALIDDCPNVGFQCSKHLTYGERKEFPSIIIKGLQKKLPQSHLSLKSITKNLLRVNDRQRSCIKICRAFSLEICAS